MKPALRLRTKNPLNIKNLTDHNNILANVLALQAEKLTFAKTKWQQEYELQKTRLKLEESELKFAKTKWELDYGLMKIHFTLKQDKLQLFKDTFQHNKEFKNQDDVN